MNLRLETRDKKDKNFTHKSSARLYAQLEIISDTSQESSVTRTTQTHQNVTTDTS